MIFTRASWHDTRRVTVCLLPHSLVIGEDCLYTSTIYSTYLYTAVLNLVCQGCQQSAHQRTYLGIQLCTQLYNILVSGMYMMICNAVMHVAAIARILAREVEGT